MAQKLKFGNGTWATKKGSTLAYNDENNNYKPLPFTTTRNSIATRVNKEGLIEVVGNDIPRIDYTDSADGVLLLEPQRLNYVAQSETFTGYWDLQGASLIADNNVKNPTGNTFSNILNSTSTGTFKSINKSESSAWDSKTLTMSCFAKKKTNDFIYFYNIGSASGSPSVYFNIGSGTLGAVGSAWSNAKIENYGNDWYRCSATITFGTATNYLYIANSDGNNNLNSTVGSQTYIWGTQIEEGSYATSYIPTSGSTVTRQADTANGSGNSEVFNGSEGVLFADISALANDLTNRNISLSDGTTSNTVRIEYLTVSNAIWGTVTNIGAGGNQAVLQYTSSDITINSKIAFKYKADDFSLWVNGFEVATDTSGVTFSDNTLNTLQFDRANYDRDFYGKTKELGYYDAVLTDSELEYLTSYRSLSELVTELNLNTL